jgi:hypothetical protein
MLLFFLLTLEAHTWAMVMALGAGCRGELAQFAMLPLQFGILGVALGAPLAGHSASQRFLERSYDVLRQMNCPACLSIYDSVEAR